MIAVRETMPVMSHLPFDPNDEQRRTVKALAAVGVPQEAIASYIGIDPKTLRKAFRAELDHGSLEANVKVAQTLFSMATVDRNVAAAIFWMKARGGWREKNVLDTDGNPQQPVQVTITTFGWKGNDSPDDPPLLEGEAA